MQKGACDYRLSCRQQQEEAVAAIRLFLIFLGQFVIGFAIES
jgi:hypothetical protein